MKILLLTFMLFGLTQSVLAMDCDALVVRMPQGLMYEQLNTEEPFSGMVTGRCAGEVKAGLQQGEWLELYPNKQIKTQGHYLDSKKTGEWLAYYDNGQLKSHHSNGQLSKRGVFVDGLPDGEWNNYNVDGQLYLRETCALGECAASCENTEDCSRLLKMSISR